jgi:uncharacterized protein (TIGR00369 family)
LITVAEAQRQLDARPFSAIWSYRVLSVGEGECRLEVPYDPRWDRPGEVLAGPVYMAAADAAMWIALMTRADEVMAVTANLDTAFLGAARQEPVTCDARVLRFGRRLVYGTAECRGADGRLLTHHTITYARPA